MRTIARFMDARNTAEGKFLSVLLSVLLVFSFLNVTMFTDYAGADTNEASEENSLPVEEPEFTEPEATAEEPEAEKASEEVTTPAPVEEKQETAVEEEPAATDVEVELQLVDATIAYDGADYGDGDKLVAPLGEDLKFSVKAAEGAEVMVAATIGDEDVILSPEADGIYILKGDQVTDALAVIGAVAEIPETDQAGDPAEEETVLPKFPMQKVPSVSERAESYAQVKTVTLEVGESYSVSCDNSNRKHSHDWESKKRSVATVTTTSGWFTGQHDTQTVRAVTPGETYISCNGTNLYKIVVTAAKPKTYTLSFDANGGRGTQSSINSIVAGTSVTLPECTYSRSGYKFIGWAKKSDADVLGGAEVFLPGTQIEVKGNEKLYAQWASSDIPSNQKVSFYVRIDGNMPTEGSPSDYSPAVGGDRYARGLIKEQKYILDYSGISVATNFYSLPTKAEIRSTIEAMPKYQNGTM